MPHWPQSARSLSYFGWVCPASNQVVVKPSSTCPSQLLSLPSQISVAGVVGVQTYSQPFVGSPSEIDVARLAAVLLARRHAAVEAADALAERVRELALVAAGAAVLGIADETILRHVVDRCRCSRCRGRRRPRRRRWSARTARRVPSRSGPVTMPSSPPSTADGTISSGVMTPLPESLQLRQYGFDLQPDAAITSTAAKSNFFIYAPPPCGGDGT